MQFQGELITGQYERALRSPSDAGEEQEAHGATGRSERAYPKRASMDIDTPSFAERVTTGRVHILRSEWTAEARVVRMVFEILYPTTTQYSNAIVAPADMSGGLRHGRAKAVGNDPRFGACCADPATIGEPPAMAKPSSGPGNASRARFVNESLA